MSRTQRTARERANEGEAAVASSERDADDRHVEELPWFFREPRNLAWLLVVCGAIGLFASASLTVEYIHKLQDPTAALVCDVNLFVTCGPAMGSWAAHILGFPNIIIGLAAFAVPIVVGMGSFAGARFRPWFWIGFQVGLVGAAALITFLQWFSVFELARLCIWCMIIWSTTIPLVVFGTLFNLTHGHLGARGVRIGRGLAPYAWTIVVLWYLVIVGVIVAGMWSTIQLVLA
ncbi:vitamin K epoxide reductase family protein [Pseudoclavibacter chungangensis]|uniref:Vitamin K epoxide reductase family protein n=1 Tax=Pseudoclavibacter chungangensis TaxID=587635 RepID=A0A7J5BYY7_9MICO|nr:vitamin K epoxide reductase family protein [Pseudoclavibacter chungangensis]KAB1659518.1 vitamin K epoxide reductase family protein [Pseudoclavibacter chungangensis]NYJ67619.1 putative membrane protein [Pseudoclavibacter chungangensis]